MKLKRIVVALAALLSLSLMATSAGASAPVRVGCITPSEYEEVDRLGQNLTDSVASFGLDRAIAPTGDQVKEQEVAFLHRRWGRLTRRWGHFRKKLD